MTLHDKTRAKCIEAMHSTFMAYKKPRGVPTTHERMVAAFNALNGIATVCPLEATEEMLDAARDWSITKNGQGIGSDQACGCFRAMAACGDLTNPPENKP